MQNTGHFSMLGLGDIVSALIGLVIYLSISHDRYFLSFSVVAIHPDSCATCFFRITVRAYVVIYNIIWVQYLSVALHSLHYSIRLIIYNITELFLLIYITAFFVALHYCNLFLLIYIETHFHWFKLLRVSAGEVCSLGEGHGRSGLHPLEPEVVESNPTSGCSSTTFITKPPTSNAKSSRQSPTEGS